MRHKKISLIGAGNIGGNLAFYLAQRGGADIVLLDNREGIPQGKALDINHLSPIFKSTSRIVGTQDFSLTRDSDLYIVSAGFPRKPGMSRDDLLQTNAEIIVEIAGNIKRHSSSAMVIVITNPVDAMTHLMRHVTGFPEKRVMGMAGVLDSARLRTLIAEELDISAEDVHAMVLGDHGDTMVPLIRCCTVAGIPLTQLVSNDKFLEIAQRVRGAGAEIVNHLKTGSASYSPAVSVSVMADSILGDRRRVLPCSAYLNGEYGVSGCYMGVPVILGADGISKIIELDLDDDEKTLFKRSYESCRTNVEKLEKMKFL